MILFLYGQDSYRSKKKLDEMRAKFLRDIDPSGLNLTELDGEKVELNELRAAVSSAPFLAKKRLVVLKNALSEHGKKGEELAEALAHVPEDTILAVYEGVGSTELEDSPAFKQLVGGKFYPEYKPLGPKELQAWIIAETKERDAEFVADGMAAYLPVAGTDCWKISNELDALAATARAQTGGKISAATVREIAHLQAEESIFDFLDAAGTRRADAAISKAEALLFQGETEVSLLVRLQSHFRGLLVAADLNANGQCTKDRLARELGVHPFAAAKLMSQSRYFKSAELEELYTWLIDADVKLKTGGWPKPRLAIDLFMVQLVK